MALLVGVFVLCLLTHIHATPWRLAFEDTFDAYQLNTSAWHMFEGYYPATANLGVTWDPASVAVANGSLMLGVWSDGQKWYAGGVRTKTSYADFRLEVTMTSPAAPHITPSVVLGDCPFANMSSNSTSPSDLYPYLTMIYTTDPARMVLYTQWYPASPYASIPVDMTRKHTYTMERSNGTYRYLIDNVTHPLPPNWEGSQISSPLFLNLGVDVSAPSADASVRYSTIYDSIRIYVPNNNVPSNASTPSNQTLPSNNATISYNQTIPNNQTIPSNHTLHSNITIHNQTATDNQTSSSITTVANTLPFSVHFNDRSPLLVKVIQSNTLMATIVLPPGIAGSSQQRVYDTSEAGYSIHLTTPSPSIPPDEHVLCSFVFNITMHDMDGRTLSRFSTSVDISFSSEALDLALLSYDEVLTQGCLGYLDESTQPMAWKCEDTSLIRDSEGMLHGTTSHFTTFGILYSPTLSLGSPPEGSNLPPSDDLDKVEGLPPTTVTVAVVVPIVACALILLGLIIYRMKQRKLPPDNIL
eukprot:TRINITY_DN11257_c0_g1_i3.p1 TRINITY_DN11257_c0_g1~~TRINITY_DN11257_c0_g1_i3.p1  ORF type:complete len:526 (+),score=87.54 TRINITY_DN11257_c0_g1_i3:208-1785(+)